MHYSRTLSTWIFSFRLQEVRDLTTEEHQLYGRFLARANLTASLFGVGAVLSALLVFIGIAIAADGTTWVWAFFIAMVVLFCVCWSKTSGESRRGLLMKRLLRLGRIAMFRRGTPPPEVRRLYEEPRIFN